MRGPVLSETPQTPYVVAGVYNSVAPAPLDQQAVGLQTDNQGNLLVHLIGSTPQPVSGQVAASVETSTVYNGTTALTPKFAKISISATGTIVAAVASKKIRVLKWDLVANGAVNIKWQSHATPSDLTGL